MSHRETNNNNNNPTYLRDFQMLKCCSSGCLGRALQYVDSTETAGLLDGAKMEYRKGREFRVHQGLL